MAGNTIAAGKAIASDPALKGKLKSAGDAASKRQVLEDAGHAGFTADQAESFKKAARGAELTDEDLQRISGGESTSTKVSTTVSEISADACEDAADAFA